MGHSFTEYESDKNATCEEDGTKTAICDHGCGEKDTVKEEGSAFGHDYESSVTKEPTCTETGVETYVCKNNPSHTYTEVIQATGHKWDEEYTIDKEASCTEDGSKSIHCKNCQETKDAVAIPALGHKRADPVKENEVAPTCETEGFYDEVVYCSVCKGEISREKKTVEATGHSWDEGTVTLQPTGNKPGIRTYLCTVCSKTKTEEISATGIHVYKEEITKEPTCTEAGIRTYTCTEEDCMASYMEEIPAIGHSFTNYVSDGNATCEEDGTKTAMCDHGCGEKDTVKEEGSAFGHDYESSVTKEPTCTETGVETYVCKNNPSHTYTEVIQATGHKWDEEYTIDKEASCTEDGSKSIHCKNCQETKDVVVIPALGHKGEEPVKENVIAPTCKTEGSYDEVIYCTVCEKEISRETKTVEKTAHTWDDGTITKEANCKEEGVRTYTCERCGDTYTESIQMKDHSWNKDYTVDKKASCAEEGLESIHCSVCNAVQKGSEREIAKSNHTYGDWTTVKKATSDSTGLKERVCKICGYVDQKDIPKTDSEGQEDADKTTSENPVSINEVDKQIITKKSDTDLKGSTFSLLQAKGVAKSKTSVKVSWKKVSGAKTYIVYGNKCGEGNQFKKLKTVSGTSYTQKKLRKGTYYKYLIVAVNGDKVLALSKNIHVATKGGKVGNNKSVTTRAKKDKVSLKKGKKFKLGAKAVAQSKKLRVKNHRGIAYESSNKKIATVSGKGVIKAVGKGTCYVYAYAQNGVCKRIKVSVK